MSDTNTNTGASISFLRQGNEFGSRPLEGGKTVPGDTASKQPTQSQPPPTSKSATLTHPRGQSRQHASNANSRQKYSLQWTAYGDLEPSGLPPWFSV